MEKKWYGKSQRLGILGGGQLGRMFIQDAIAFDVAVHSLDPDKNAPCKEIANEFTVGSLTDYDTVMNFGADKDVLTIEIENVNIDALKELEKQGKKVFPQPNVIEIIQDKGLQKQFYADKNIPTAPFTLHQSKEELIASNPVFPFVNKLRKGGYDGKGVQIIKSQSDLENVFDAPSIIETMIPFEKELSVIVARNERGQTVVYPTVECEFSPTANLVEFLFSPADVTNEIEENAKSIALEVINQLGMVGILAVEFFLLKDGSLLVNEIAPRPHNSGHHTIECNITSQFEQHMRSVLNLPLGSTKMIQSGVMINLIGEPNFEGNVFYEGIDDILDMEGVHIHLYGKSTTKPNRKMGHITITSEDIEVAKSTARKVQKMIRVISN
jgi:5-(carboxyamino)imidazole ribonucleotide synthase